MSWLHIYHAGFSTFKKHVRFRANFAQSWRAVKKRRLMLNGQQGKPDSPLELLEKQVGSPINVCDAIRMKRVRGLEINPRCVVSRKAQQVLGML